MNQMYKIISLEGIKRALSDTESTFIHAQYHLYVRNKPWQDVLS